MFHEAAGGRKRRKFSREFKVGAVKLVRERGVSVAQACRDLDVHENVLRKWVKEFGSNPAQAFRGHGQMKPEQQEIDRLRREVAKLKVERDILKMGRSLLREGSDKKFVFIAKRRAIWPVAWLCDALGVSRSAFHAWLNRSPSARSRSDEELGGKVKASFVASDRTYGVVSSVMCSPTVRTVGRHQIERLMRLQGLGARPRRRRLPRDGDDRQLEAVPANLLDRQFAAERPNQKWIADFTYLWTAEGWLYVAAVIDLFSRRVVG